MKKGIKIEPRKMYSLGEIVRLGFVPGVTSVVIASRLVKSGLLVGESVPRGLRGVQYQVKGSAITSYLKDHHGVKDKKG